MSWVQGGTYLEVDGLGEATVAVFAFLGRLSVT